MKFSVKCIVLFSVLLCVPADKLPAAIKKCKSKDNDCVKNSIQEVMPIMKNGYPDIELDCFEPLLIPKMTIGESKIVQLVQHYENMQVNGLSDGTITYASFDLDKGKFFFDMETPVIDLNATYSIEGKVLVMDVYGKGSSLIRMEQTIGKFAMDLETYTKNNEKYLKGSNSQLSLGCQHAVFQFDNLFDGNKQLGDNINQVLNDNWKEIYAELEPSYTAAIGTSLMDLVNKVFSKIPLKELFID